MGECLPGAPCQRVQNVEDVRARGLRLGHHTHDDLDLALEVPGRLLQLNVSAFQMASDNNRVIHEPIV